MLPELNVSLSGIARAEGTSGPVLQVAGVTDVGRVRRRNEDAIDWDLPLGLAMVADGMGGSQGGDIASRTALQSINRYLAKELGPKGIRSNLVAAGPVKTMAAKSIPGFKRFEDVWDGRAPLGWDVEDGTAVAKAVVALLSDWFPATTGEVVHVDGGFHSTAV